MYKELIAKVVGNRTVVRQADLALEVMAQVNPLKFKNDEYLSALESMVETRQLLLVTYTTPDSKTRVLYFPFGTTFDIGVIK